MATQLEPPAGFREELAAQAEQGGLITSGDWSQGSDKWAHAWLAVCQVRWSCNSQKGQYPDINVKHVFTWS